MSLLNHGSPSDLPVIVLPSDPNVIPAELREKSNWVCWHFVPEEPTEKNPDPKPRKVPLIAGTLFNASTTDPAHWRSFEVAWNAAKASDGSMGIGFVFTAEDPYCGVDLDDCINEQGDLTPDAKALIERFVTYCEVSPSATGVKMILKGKKPPSAGASVSNVMGCGKIEIYDDKRYFTVTGQALKGWTCEIAECQEQLDVLCRELWPPKQRSESTQTWIKPLCSTPSTSDISHISMDKRESRCMAYVEKCPDAISGQGGHNTTLRAACECFRFGLDDAAVWRVMQWFNANKTGGEPWTEKELRHKIESARQKVESNGEGGMRLVSTQSTSEAVVVGEDWFPERQQPTHHLEAYCVPHLQMAQLVTDVGNAARLVSRYGESLRFCHETGRWYCWDGTRWCVDVKGEIMFRSKNVALSILDEAKQCRDDRRDDLLKWARASQKRERITAMAALAQADVAITTDDLDVDPWLFNCQNGTVDLRTGELRPHSPQDFITKISPVVFDPGAPCPIFDSFLHRIFDGDHELITFVQRWHGHCLTGDVREQYMPIYHGEGNNGKSVLLDTISSIMGDFACEAPPHLVTLRKQDEHATEIADLMGRRLVIASETEKDAELRVQLIKRLTGNERLKGRYMRQDFFQFRRTHKMVLVTNNPPVIRENSEAVWRRLRLVPFRVIIPKQERDPKLMEKLKAEWPGILAWIVRGCVDWQREGLTEPIAVMHATQRYRGSASSLEEFVNDCCELGNGLVCASGTFHAAYEEWCDENKRRPLQARALADALRSIGCENQKISGERCWLNIQLREQPSS